MSVLKFLRAAMLYKTNLNDSYVMPKQLTLDNHHVGFCVISLSQYIRLRRPLD
jgi:hypothetical protein